MTCKGLREHKNTNLGSNGFQIGYLARDYSHKTQKHMCWVLYTCPTSLTALAMDIYNLDYYTL